MSIKYIVTGGAGFIGSNVVAALNARGEDDVLIVDELGTSEKWKNLRGLRFEDVLHKDAFRTAYHDDAFKDVEAVFHLGACSDTTERDADYLLDNNYQYTRELCEWCLQDDIRFIYASSAATYGDGSKGYSDEETITPALHPLNMYGYSKQMFDLWALKHGVFNSIVGLKYFNVYGPGEAHKGDMRSLVHKAFGRISEEGRLGLFKSYKPDYKDGEQVRDFIYVKDAVDVTLHFLDHRDVSGLFNCGTGQSRSWLDLAHAVFDAMGKDPDIYFIDMPDQLQGKYQYFTEADAAKLRRAGFTAEFMSLEDGIKDYVQRHLIHE
jgi:ADP-L-glycero-D-manno-heptose 6-epimerase